MPQIKRGENMAKKDAKEFPQNDIYFLEILGDKLLVNDNYEGVLIFDSEFVLLKKMKISDNLAIAFSIKKGNEILLICPENRKIIYIDTRDYQHKIISLEQFEDWVFSSLFDWKGNIITLSDYKGNLAKLDLEKAKLFKLGEYSHIKTTVSNAYQKLNGFRTNKIFPLEEKAIVEDSIDGLELIDYEDNIVPLIRLRKEEFYDFELSCKHIAEIGEYKAVTINFENEKFQQYYPQEKYYFLRGKMMVTKQENFLFLLSAKKSDEKKSLIEKYSL